MLKIEIVENVNHKMKVMELEGEVDKLSGCWNNKAIDTYKPWRLSNSRTRLLKWTELEELKFKVYKTYLQGWDQSNQVGTSQPPQDSSGYNYYGQPQNPRFNYNQTPNVASHGYDRAYAQEPPSYGGQAPVSDYQQQYATSGYGSPAVPSIRDATATQSSTGQPHPGYYQAGYVGQQGVEGPSAESQPAAYGHGAIWTQKHLGTNVQTSAPLPMTTDSGILQDVLVAVLERRLIKKRNAAATEVLVQWKNHSKEDAT
ncbi:hypothetical protein DVH24_042215 [Malus domestica]|uniref:Uncharacterized protein n=1 Tax=Malus domestica TaxID=3750 RepID=A0A498J1B4_MALDO|nr:hypothetical protein DVH24_042215 [Malus domestica]